MVREVRHDGLLRQPHHDGRVCSTDCQKTYSSWSVQREGGENIALVADGSDTQKECKYIDPASASEIISSKFPAMNYRADGSIWCIPQKEESDVGMRLRFSFKGTWHSI